MLKLEKEKRANIGNANAFNLDANPKIQKEIRRKIGIAEDEEISNALAVAVAALIKH